MTAPPERAPLTRHPRTRKWIRSGGPTRLKRALVEQRDRNGIFLALELSLEHRIELMGLDRLALVAPLVACACANARRRPTLFVRLGASGGGAARTGARGAGADNATTAAVVGQEANGGDGAAIVAGAVRALPRLRRLFVAFDDGGGRARRAGRSQRDAAADARRIDDGSMPLRALARVFDAAAAADARASTWCRCSRAPAGGARAAEADGARGGGVALLGVDALIIRSCARGRRRVGARRERAPRRGGAARGAARRRRARAAERRARALFAPTARARTRPTTRRRASLRRRRSAALSTGSTPDTGCCSPRARS